MLLPTVCVFSIILRLVIAQLINGLRYFKIDTKINEPRYDKRNEVACPPNLIRVYAERLQAI